MDNKENLQEDIEATLEQRADYIPPSKLVDETASGSGLFVNAQKALLSTALKTIVGPRGCGKTHMMRYAWLMCQKEESKPFAIYASFNKYYRLEPLLISRASASDEFHAWVLANVALATYHSLGFSDDSDAARLKRSQHVNTLEDEYDLPRKDLENLVSALERNKPLSINLLKISERLSISNVKALIDRACSLRNRKRSVLYLDDAALTLTPAYMMEMLDLVRALKSSSIAPKASVYPGTTEYSPRFHSGQDSTSIFVWPAIDSPDYASDMDEIARARVQDFDQISPDVVTLIRFAAFGIPRAYLTMLQEFKDHSKKNLQQKLNAVIEDHLNARIAEYRSLSVKVPKFSNLIKVGEQVLQGMVNSIKEANKSPSFLQLTVGVAKEDITAISERMFQLLIEAGLIYDSNEVKHGTPERIYQRYIPHGAILYRSRAITSSDSGGPLKSMVVALEKKKFKHPVRRKLEKLVPDAGLIKNLSFSLPPCQNCNFPRVNEAQKFCSNCGLQLLLSSTFETCLSKKIDEVPGLTAWQLEKIHNELPKLNTIHDYLAMQDPVLELFTVYGFGPRRSARIADLLQSFVDDYLS